MKGLAVFAAAHQGDAHAVAGAASAVANALFFAARAGDAQAVAAWLNEGGGVDARCIERGRTTLLMAAAQGGQEAMVRMLLQRGASINLQDYLGVTALMGAALYGRTPRSCRRC